MDAAYKRNDGKPSFGYRMMLNNYLVCVGVDYGPKLHSSKGADPRASFFMRYRNLHTGIFLGMHFFFYAKEVNDSINGKANWVINQIILDIKSECIIFLSQFLFCVKIFE